MFAHSCRSSAINFESHIRLSQPFSVFISLYVREPCGSSWKNVRHECHRLYLDFAKRHGVEAEVVPFEILERDRADSTPLPTRHLTGAGYTFRMTAAEQVRAERRRATWTLEKVNSFAEAEAQTRAYWHAATLAERLNALAQLREVVCGKAAANARVERVLELVPQPSSDSGSRPPQPPQPPLQLINIPQMRLAESLEHRCILRIAFEILDME